MVFSLVAGTVMWRTSLSSWSLGLINKKEAQKFGCVHNIPTPPNRVFDLVVHQMRQRLKTSKKSPIVRK